MIKNHVKRLYHVPRTLLTILIPNGTGHAGLASLGNKNKYYTLSNLLLQHQSDRLQTSINNHFYKNKPYGIYQLQ